MPKLTSKEKAFLTARTNAGELFIDAYAVAAAVASSASGDQTHGSDGGAMDIYDLIKPIVVYTEVGRVECPACSGSGLYELPDGDAQQCCEFDCNGTGRVTGWKFLMSDGTVKSGFEAPKF